LYQAESFMVADSGVDFTEKEYPLQSFLCQMGRTNLLSRTLFFVKSGSAEYNHDGIAGRSFDRTLVVYTAKKLFESQLMGKTY
jgi:hypothetical protein